MFADADARPCSVSLLEGFGDQTECVRGCMLSLCPPVILRELMVSSARCSLPLAFPSVFAMIVDYWLLLKTNPRQHSQ